MAERMGSLNLEYEDDSEPEDPEPSPSKSPGKVLEEELIEDPIAKQPKLETQEGTTAESEPDEEEEMEEQRLAERNPAKAFQTAALACLSTLSVENLGEGCSDVEHMKVTSEFAVSAFTDALRALEAEWGKKQILWTAHCPQMALEEEVRLLKIEVERKRQLLLRFKQPT